MTRAHELDRIVTTFIHVPKIMNAMESNAIWSLKIKM